MGRCPLTAMPPGTRLSTKGRDGKAPEKQGFHCLTSAEDTCDPSPLPQASPVWPLGGSWPGPLPGRTSAPTRRPQSSAHATSWKHTQAEPTAERGLRQWPPLPSGHSGLLSFPSPSTPRTSALRTLPESRWHAHGSGCQAGTRRAWVGDATCGGEAKAWGARSLETRCPRLLRLWEVHGGSTHMRSPSLPPRPRCCSWSPPDSTEAASEAVRPDSVLSQPWGVTLAFRSPGWGEERGHSPLHGAA